MNKPVALITGATGAVGPSLVSCLIDKGYIVKTFSRRPPAVNLLHPASTHLSGSITDATALDSALVGVSVVFHLAAILHIENPGAELASEYHRVNVDGARLTAERAYRAGVRRFVHFSTVKVYGTRQQQPIMEEFPTAPETLYARTKYQSEQAVHSIDGLEVVTLRLSPVYGPRLRGSWARLVHAIASGRFLPIGNLNNVHSLTHVDDVAHAALIAAEHTNAVGRVFNVVGHERPTMRDILTAIYRANGRELPPIRIPSLLALIGAYILEKSFGLISKKPPLSVDALRQLTEDEAYSGQLLRELGFSPQVGLAEGWGVTPPNA